MGLISIPASIVPVVFILPEGRGQLQMVDVSPWMIDPSQFEPATQSGDAGGWIAQLIERQLHDAELTSRIHPLLPRPMESRRLAIPVWATARLRRHARGAPGQAPRPAMELSDPREALSRLGRELGDRGFGRHVMASVRAAFALDPFAQRVVGDAARLGALSEDHLPDDPLSVARLPAVIGLLPAQFTLGELQEAIAATLELPPHAMESGSNFRRRLEKLVLSNVLREATGSRESGGSDRPGRPPRRYEFDPYAWRRWLEQQGERASGSPGSSFAPEYESGESPDMRERRMMLERQEMEERRMRAARNYAQMPDSRAESRADSRADLSGDDEASRIARLERMVERLAREVQKRKSDL